MKKNNIDTEVLIAGAGMTGLTLACDLLRRGVDFRIIDKLQDYFPGSRGKGLQPRSLEVFDDLGVVDQLMPYGMFHPIIRQYEGSKIFKDVDLSEGLKSTPNIPYGAPFWIPQFQIESTLREHLFKGGKQVELSTKLTNIEQDADGVTATVQKNGQTQQIRCVYLVASDGGRSFVRKFLNLNFLGETREAIRMLVGDVHTDALDHEHTHMWPKHPDGFVALTPFPKVSIFQYQAQVAPDFDEEPTLKLFQRILNERSGTDIKLYDPTWLSSFKVNIRMVDTSVIGRICIAGDASHVHSPAGGQGMNTGIQDAYNLGWKLDLVLKGADPKLIETYQEERLPVAAGVLGLSTRLLDKFVGSERSLPNDKDRLQLNINYRDSSLSKQTTSKKLPLQAGDRAPDAPLLDTNGKQLRLFDLFRGPHFTVITTGEISSQQLNWFTEEYNNIMLFCVNINPDDGCYFDVQGAFASAYGSEHGVIYLVRPDGYIGFIGEHIQDMIEYMEALC